MNAETLEQHRRTIMSTMRELGGTARVQQLTAAAVIPSVLLREVMRSLIASGLVQLVSDDRYVLRPSAPAPAPAPVEPAKVEGIDFKAEPREPVVSSTVPPPPGEKKRCVRCEELWPLSKFPKRPGMVRAARVCEDCCPADDTIGSPRDRKRANLPEDRDQVPGPTVTALDGAAPADLVYVLEVRFPRQIADYLDNLTSTGLFGTTREATAELLLREGIRRELLGAKSTT